METTAHHFHDASGWATAELRLDPGAADITARVTWLPAHADLLLAAGHARFVEIAVAHLDAYWGGAAPARG